MLNLIKKSVLVGKVLTSAKIKLLIFIREVFGNSRMFPDPKRDWEATSPEWRDRVGTGKRLFPDAWDGKFSGFFWKNQVPEKWHAGTQTSKIYNRGHKNCAVKMEWHKFSNGSRVIMGGGWTANQCQVCQKKSAGFTYTWKWLFALAVEMLNGFPPTYTPP